MNYITTKLSALLASVLGLASLNSFLDAGENLQMQHGLLKE